MGDAPNGKSHLPSMHSPEQDTEAQGTVHVSAPSQIVVQVEHCAAQLAEEVATEIQPVFCFPGLGTWRGPVSVQRGAPVV